jgi:hypothetical protein
MNTRLEALAREAGTVGLRHDAVGIVRKACRISLNQGRSGLHWLKVTIRTVDSRRDDLERMHWKKVWRSLFD